MLKTAVIDLTLNMDDGDSIFNGMTGTMFDVDCVDITDPDNRWILLDISEEELAQKIADADCQDIHYGRTMVQQFFYANQKLTDQALERHGLTGYELIVEVHYWEVDDNMPAPILP